MHVVRMPFKMLPSRRASYRRDGKHIVSGRASFVWQNVLEARVAGIPGVHEVKADTGTRWHRIDLSIEEAEEAYLAWRTLHREAAISRLRRTRAARERRGLPVG